MYVQKVLLYLINDTKFVFKIFVVESILLLIERIKPVDENMEKNCQDIEKQDFLAIKLKYIINIQFGFLKSLKYYLLNN
jgi:hypothetical protein